jgi:peptidoglycan hydrolase-like protein with peptidoglycan-binding domain
MKTLRDYIKLIEAPELGGKGIMPAPGTKRADPPVGDAGLPVAPQSQQIAPAKPTTVTPAAPKAAPHQYVPGATWNQGVLGIGSTGPEVDKLRQHLGLAPNGGKFDNETRDAVIQRQRELGVTADGAWGPGTARADAAKPKTAPQPAEPEKVPPADDSFYVPKEIARGQVGPDGKPLPIPADPSAGTDGGINNLDPSQFHKGPAPLIDPGQFHKGPYTPNGGAVTTRPVRPATGARATAIQNRQAQNQTPEGMSNSDAQLLEKMLTIAGLR